MSDVTEVLPRCCRTSDVTEAVSHSVVYHIDVEVLSEVRCEVSSLKSYLSEVMPQQWCPSRRCYLTLQTMTHLVDFGYMLSIPHCVERSSSSRAGTYGASRTRKDILASSLWCRLPRWSLGGDTVSQDVRRIRRKARPVLDYASSSRLGQLKLKLNFG